MRYHDLLFELRNCGILLYPFDEDIINTGYHIKNHDAQDRAIQDIVMACRSYAIKSHKMNPIMSKDIIVAKFKPNIDYDLYFFDDEEVILKINFLERLV
jgi:hypothetical protein